MSPHPDLIGRDQVAVLLTIAASARQGIAV